MNPRTILFIHQAFPGQFGSLARSLAEDGHRVFALAMNPQKGDACANVIRYPPIRKQLDDTAPYMLREFDAKLIRAESIYMAMKAMKDQGFNPDVVYAHPGWGEGLFVKNVWPNARFVVYAEWFYNLRGQELNFDPDMPPLSEEGELRLSLKNTPFLHALSECDAAISPTQWQKSRFPDWAQEKITVLHDGLPLRELAKVRPRALGIPSQNLRLRHGMPIVTYAARHLEPVRGFHYFMRSLPAILDGNPEAHVIIMGQDAGIKNIGYGRENPAGTSWRKSLEKELGDKVDWKRVHFLGMLDRELFLAMLKLSACHIYLTTPFILSWSFLETAALGLPIVASDTAPVREFGGLDSLELVEFNDVEAIAEKTLNRLENMTGDFAKENLEILRDLDSENTLPKIQHLLLKGSSSRDLGGDLESVVLLDDEED